MLEPSAKVDVDVDVDFDFDGDGDGDIDLDNYLRNIYIINIGGNL